MTKKIIAMLLALSMVFTMCGLTAVFAEETTNTETKADNEPVAQAEESTEPEADEPDEPTVIENPIVLSLKSSYKQDTTVVITGEINDPDIAMVKIEVTCIDDDDIYESERLTEKEFTGTGFSYSLRGADAGTTYEVRVTDVDDKTKTVVKEFAVLKNSTVDDSKDDGTGNVTIWIDGLTERYVDKQVVSLNQVSDETVLGVAEYLLEEVVDRNYREDSAGKKINRIATTETGSTYLKDGQYSSTALKDAQWCYFVNGRNYPEDMCDKKVKGGDEIVLYYGVPGVTGYPVVTVSPDSGISVGDYLEVTVLNRVTDPETYECTETPIKSARVGLIKRNAEKVNSSSGSTNASGYWKSSKISSSWLSSYQGGRLRVYSFGSSSRAMPMVSKDIDIDSERSGYVQATITIEGAHETLMEAYKPSSSKKIEEYDLYNYAKEVFDDQNIDYEINSAKNNFTYFESKSTKGYSNENGDVTDDGAWYVTVNGEKFGPKDNLRNVQVYTDDEIVFYFGDDDTVYAYYDIRDELKSGETVRVYFYYDSEFVNPIKGMPVYFDGSGKSVRYKTDSDGMIRLDSVDYRGTYNLEWGEHVDVKDDVLPEYVYNTVEMKYSGPVKPANKDDDDQKTTKPKNNGDDDDDDDDDTKPTKPKATDPDDDDDNDFNDRPTDPPTTPWDPGDFQPNDPNKSQYFPDTDISAWAVKEIDRAYDLGLVHGDNYNRFNPQSNITKAEFSAIIVRILSLNSNPSDYPTEKFPDVKKSDWYYGEVMAVVTAGIAGGDLTTGRFNPTESVTRQQIAVMVANTIGDINAPAYNFGDSDQIASWAVDAFNKVKAAGIMEGDQFNNVSPNNLITREQATAVAVRLYDYLHK